MGHDPILVSQEHMPEVSVTAPMLENSQFGGETIEDSIADTTNVDRTAHKAIDHRV